MPSQADYYSNTNWTLTRDFQRAGKVVGTAFYPNKFNQLITEHCSLEENVKGYQERIQQLLANNTLCAQADDFSAVAVWTPPEWNIVPYPQEVLHGTFGVSEDEFKRCAVKYFRGGPHWHLTFVGKAVDSNTKGSVSKVMKPFLEDALNRGCPAALECIDERAKSIYEYYGFKTYEVIKVGKDEVDINGEPDPHGEGLSIYYMIYNYTDDEFKPLE